MHQKQKLKRQNSWQQVEDAKLYVHDKAEGMFSFCTCVTLSREEREKCLVERERGGQKQTERGRRTKKANGRRMMIESRGEETDRDIVQERQRETDKEREKEGEKI